MGPKNVAMFLLVDIYIYDKPEAKIIKSVFLSKPASLSLKTKMESENASLAV